MAGLLYLIYIVFHVFADVIGRSKIIVYGDAAADLFLPVSQLLLSGADYLKVFQFDQLQALAMLSLYLHKNGFMIAQIFYSAWLFPLGYTVFKSGFLPRILGIVLMIHCATWLMTALQFFLFPGFEAITFVSYPLGFIAEFGLTLWLLIMGVKAQKPILANAQKQK